MRIVNRFIDPETHRFPGRGGRLKCRPFQRWLHLGWKKDAHFHSAQEAADGWWRYRGLTADLYHFVYGPNSGSYFVKRLLADGVAQGDRTIDLRAAGTGYRDCVSSQHGEYQRRGDERERSGSGCDHRADR